MQINYFPGRLRVRDKVLRDNDIRNAALDAARAVFKITNTEYNERTASLLVEYDAETAPPLKKLKTLIPLARKLEPKIRFYDERKKGEILAGIAKAEEIIKSWNV